MKLALSDTPKTGFLTARPKSFWQTVKTGLVPVVTPGVTEDATPSS